MWSFSNLEEFVFCCISRNNQIKLTTVKLKDGDAPAVLWRYCPGWVSRLTLKRGCGLPELKWKSDRPPYRLASLPSIKALSSFQCRSLCPSPVTQFCPDSPSRNVPRHPRAGREIGLLFEDPHLFPSYLHPLCGMKLSQLSWYLQQHSGVLLMNPSSIWRCHYITSPPSYQWLGRLDKLPNGKTQRAVKWLERGISSSTLQLTAATQGRLCNVIVWTKQSGSKLCNSRLKFMIVIIMHLECVLKRLKNVQKMLLLLCWSASQLWKSACGDVTKGRLVFLFPSLMWKIQLSMFFFFSRKLQSISFAGGLKQMRIWVFFGISRVMENKKQNVSFWA